LSVTPSESEIVSYCHAGGSSAFIGGQLEDEGGITVYSALYYPHTNVQSTSLLKTALLMWDELHIIVPEEGFRFSGASKDASAALEVIAHRRVPTPAEKRAAHELIDDFVKQPLPLAFSYTDTSRAPYELYPQKLMTETWDLLQEANLVGRPLPNQDYPTATQTGLSIMSILADCCAGAELTRVTDRVDAHAFLSDSVVEHTRVSATDAARQELVSVPLRVASAEDIPLDKLVAMRQREKAGKTPGLAALRHRLVNRIEKEVSELAAAKTESDQRELKQRFEQFLADDLLELREALKMETVATLSSKTVVASVLGVVGAFSPLLAAALPPLGLPLAAVVGAGSLLKAGAALGSIRGLINTNVKFAKTRIKVLKDHPTAYLYEALGGHGRF
jgi:hypothetical protein